MRNSVDQDESFFFRLRMQGSKHFEYLILDNPLQINYKFFFKIRKNLEAKKQEKINELIKDKESLGELFFDGNKIYIDKQQNFRVLVSGQNSIQFKEYKKQFQYNEPQILRVKIISDHFNIEFDKFEILRSQKPNVTPQRPKLNFIYDPYFNARLALYNDFLTKDNFKDFLRQGKTFHNTIFYEEPFNQKEFKEVLKENDILSTKKRQSKQHNSLTDNQIDEVMLKRKKQPIDDLLSSNFKNSSQSKSKSISEDDIQCCICIQNFNIIKARSKECKHEYCFDCVMEWLQVQNTCPLCKVQINRIEKFKNNKKIEEIPIEHKVMELEEEVDEELENADNFCYKCKREDNQNVLLVCDHCVRKCCHTFCLDPPLEFIPETDWFCDYCVIQRRVQTVQPIANIYIGGNRQAQRHRNRQNNNRQRRNQNQRRNNQGRQQKNQDQRDRQINSIAVRRTNSKRKLEEEIEKYIQQTQISQNNQNRQSIRDHEDNNPLDDEITKFIESLDNRIQ